MASPLKSIDRFLQLRAARYSPSLTGFWMTLHLFIDLARKSIEQFIKCTGIVGWDYINLFFPICMINFLGCRCSIHWNESHEQCRSKSYFHFEYLFSIICIQLALLKVDRIIGAITLDIFQSPPGIKCLHLAHSWQWDLVSLCHSSVPCWLVANPSDILMYLLI